MRTAIGNFRDWLRAVVPGHAAVQKAIARFRLEQAGNVAIIFGLSLVPLTFLIGMGIDFSSAIQKRTYLNAAADAAALAAVTPPMMAQSNQAVTTAAQNMFNAEAAAVGGLNSLTPNVVVTESALTRTVTVSYTASSANSFANVLGEAGWPISGSSQAASSAAPNINFYLMLDNSPSMDLPATTAGINAMIAATKNAPS